MELADPTFVIVLGRCAAGGTSVAQRLSDFTGWPFVDADDFQPRAGNAGAAGGRGRWLDALGAWIDAREVRGDSAVVACRGLPVQERARLRQGRDRLKFLVLSGPDCEPLQPGEPGLELDADRSPADVLHRVVEALDLS